MAVTVITWVYLIMSSVSAVVNLLLSLLLFANFLRRKTIGTLILAFSFIVTAIGETMFSLTFWLQAFSESVQLEVTGVIYYIGMVILSSNTYFYYYFGNRFVIRDNDVYKSLISLVFCVTIGITLGLGTNYILQGIISPGIVVYGYLPEADLTMYIIGYYLGLSFVPTSVIFVFGRIVYKGIAMQRQTKDIIVKKGLVYVLVASVLHILGAATRTLAFWIEAVRIRPILSVAIFSAGVIITFIALILYYLGWVMPNWLKRRFREQAWFTKIYTGKIAEPSTPKSNIETNLSKNSFVEIIEK